MVPANKACQQNNRETTYRDHFMKNLDLQTQTLTVFFCAFFICYGTMLLGDELGDVNTKEPTPEAVEFFESKIRPLLLNR